MCGICGAIDLTGRPIPDLERRLEVMNALIAHRGPDDDGLWTHHRGHVGLAHRRLSIIDLEHGHQPMSGRAEPLDHLQRRDLQLPRAATGDRRGSLPHDVRHRGRAPGPRALGHRRARPASRHVRLRAVGRAAQASSCCVRDRFGIKPLYYATVGDVVLLRLGGESPAPVPAVDRDGPRCAEGLPRVPVLPRRQDAVQGRPGAPPGPLPAPGPRRRPNRSGTGRSTTTSTSTTPRSTSRSRSRRCCSESVELHLRSDVPVGGVSQRWLRLERRGLARPSAHSAAADAGVHRQVLRGRALRREPLRPGCRPSGAAWSYTRSTSPSTTSSGISATSSITSTSRSPARARSRSSWSPRRRAATAR